MLRAACVQAQDVHLKVSVGYELFNLHSHEIIREPALDTKVLIAWGDDMVVVAFRGTASAKNAATDIQVGCVRKCLFDTATCSTCSVACSTHGLCLPLHSVTQLYMACQCLAPYGHD